MVDKRIPNDRIRQQRLGRRRWKRELAKRQRGGGSAPHDEGQYLGQILQICCQPERGLLAESRGSYSRGRHTIHVPKQFSVISNPDESLQALKGLVDVVNHRQIKRLFLDHGNCAELGLGASIVMDILILELMASFRRSQSREIYVGGKFPEDERVREILRATGIIKHLKVEHEILDNPERYKLFDLVRGRHEKVKSTKTSAHEIAAEKLTSYFDECLQAHGFELTSDGKRNLSSMTGEVLGNAEEHSGTHKWFIVGYMMEQSSGIGLCNISVVNFGQTIYETLSSERVDPMLRQKLRALSSKHRGFFGTSYSEEALWTLYALQEGVSRHGFKSTRGWGTVQLIRFFQQLGDTLGEEQPAMCVLSGSAHILFDGTYQMPAWPETGVIAFNNENDLERKPDGRCVRSLESRFPGTVVSMRFFLDQSYLEQLQGGRDV